MPHSTQLRIFCR